MMPLNPKKVESLMKQLGVKFDDIEEVEEIIIKCKDCTYIIKSHDVKIVTAGGVRTLQAVISDLKKEENILIEEEDIKILMEKAGIEYNKAKELLLRKKGDLAQALLEIQEKEEKGSS